MEKNKPSRMLLFFSCIGSKHVPGAATLKLVNMSINLFEVYILLFSIKGEVKRNPFS
jgi:hypothetical protein